MLGTRRNLNIMEKDNNKVWRPPRYCGYCTQFIRDENKWTCWGHCKNPQGLSGKKGTFSIACKFWVWNVGEITVEGIGTFKW